MSRASEISGLTFFTSFEDDRAVIYRYSNHERRLMEIEFATVEIAVNVVKIFIDDRVSTYGALAGSFSFLVTNHQLFRNETQ